MLLRLENVSQRFGELAAVNDLSFSVDEGEVFGIAGPNGAGKTTVFNVISGFYHGSGRITFDGRRIDSRAPHAICRMGIARTFQIPAVFESMTVRQHFEIGEYFGYRGAGKKSVWSDLDEIVRFLGLEHVVDSRVSTVKLYDKKLTVLGAALATRPKLLLLDEAIAGLSVIEAEQALELFKRLNNERGVTIIIIEHVMSVLTQLCDRLLVMDNGSALMEGRPDEVMNSPEVEAVLLGVTHA